MASEVRRWVRICVWGVLMIVLMCVTPAECWIFIVSAPLFFYAYTTARRDDRVQEEFRRIVEAHYGDRTGDD